MIIAPKKYKAGTIIETDICIIGGGPAAISLALSFLNQHSKIVILAGGSWKEFSPVFHGKKNPNIAN
jgi:hypothetical protein